MDFTDIGYVLVSGQTPIAGTGVELLENPDSGLLFLGGEGVAEVLKVFCNRQDKSNFKDISQS